MPSNAITDCPIYQVLWDFTAYWGKEVHHKYEANARWGAVNSRNRITRWYFPPRFFKHWPHVNLMLDVPKKKTVSHLTGQYGKVEFITYYLSCDSSVINYSALNMNECELQRKLFLPDGGRGNIQTLEIVEMNVGVRQPWWLRWINQDFASPHGICEHPCLVYLVCGFPSCILLHIRCNFIFSHIGVILPNGLKQTEIQKMGKSWL